MSNFAIDLQLKYIKQSDVLELIDLYTIERAKGTFSAATRYFPILEAAQVFMERHPGEDLDEVHVATDLYRILQWSERIAERMTR